MPWSEGGKGGREIASNLPKTTMLMERNLKRSEEPNRTAKTAKDKIEGEDVGCRV